ncbi:c-type cytochrome [Flavihumibacter rivuli]|uniref:cbb3-type cytochrome c oxidase N-terminal domain-containing protein n=1 Tax=Flavihumibacter rivuli TaxID=2838156 RepID=UPI001BDDE30E|nr:cbb3-type cytochrome c oxidase N-terminal domain-containing protein [Flavihumibacter rivuli]ULQ58408.1 c-type cytochrome [Flavihumibacter rivuli]
MMQPTGRVAILMTALLTGTLPVWAKGAAGPPPPDALENPMALTLLVIIAVLALVIAMLAYVVTGAAGVFIAKFRKERSGATPAAMIIGLLLLAGPAAFAQDTAASSEAVSSVIAGLDKSTFYMLLGVIAVEIIAILYLLYNLQLLIRQDKAKAVTEEEKAAEATKAAAPRESWWDKFNKFKPVEEEADIDLGHNYDGIRELDNRLPPWWLYGFYLCIIFAAIYLWRYHVSHTAPSSQEEYEMAMAKAELEKEEYLKKAANKVDENTVAMMDASGVAAGQGIYITNCAACHGKLGEGGVGPNLTDDYWLHGGKINDVFKTIKYGVPEKGMKSWKDDFSPTQIAQLSSFIKSLYGTNPPNAKEKQGELYTEGSAAPKSDSTATTAQAKDSTAVTMAN